MQIKVFKFKIYLINWWIDLRVKGVGYNNLDKTISDYKIS